MIVDLRAAVASSRKTRRELLERKWKSVYMTVRNEEPRFMPPTLNEMIRMIATLSGFVNRRSTQPGPQALWLGLQRVHDLSTAWQTFGPE